MSKKAKNMKSVIVTVTDEAMGNIENLAKQLGNSGMKVNHVLHSTGVITGICSAAKMASLQKIKGVMSIEEEIILNLPPPDSPLQ